ncbi:cobalt ABC transporter ATP-binding protein [Rhodococcoides trifolii]|uniref:Cobalt ABC transporter ATP-binding protein n=1 Tax=Rhodococcoides trifolii TaxID=908250 RepID=A0A917LGR9_9NOCA|nr:ATP-binding cassette domain-containing protein [Rhodococcus trifolii]GGG21892.1 cobalt ABC transporter ATP-binding protein [Rhodococcus trifolii]
MTRTDSNYAKRAALRPAELATGSVMAALAVAFSVVGELVPAAGALQFIAIVPLAVIAQRHRLRALTVASTGAVVVAFVASGTGAVISMVITAVIGGIVGRTKRRGGSIVGVLAQSVLAGVAFGAITTGLLFLLEPLRTLIISVIDNSIRGTTELFARYDAFADAATTFADGASTVLRYWWVLVFVSTFVGTVISAVFAWYVLAAILARLDGLEQVDSLGPVNDGPIGPLPVRLRGVSYRYPDARADALDRVDIEVGEREFVAVVGANGSGKSTLARLLVGAEPTAGTIDRPGVPGLGLHGGTALILQHPETQVLGSRVGDDVLWGLPIDEQPDADGVEALLAEVGLSGYAARETSGLSGGELQRLAVAAALARRPRLLVADEATAMIDPAGQRHLVDVLAALPRRHEMSVVLITHRITEAERAERVVHLERGAVVDHRREWMAPAPMHPPLAESPGVGPVVLELRGLGHVYARRTPWATRALTGIDLAVHRGEGVLIVGGNGSGKSTLAWIMAGLVAPSEGTATVDGAPISSKVGTVALSFQHARLQLQRRTVGEDIAAAGGPEVGSREVSFALDSVGLDRMMAGRRIDQLSGGQMRRVALAGLLITRPALLILDEPLAGLDPPGRREITGLLADLRRSGLTLVVISHDLDGMESVRTRTVTLDSGTLVGTPEGVTA